MAVEVINRIYENRPYIFHKGLDDTGRFVEYIEEGVKYTNNLTGRFFPAQKFIQHDEAAGNGNLSFILTYFKWALFDDAGVMVSAAKDTHPLFGSLSIQTNTKDEADFEMRFGPEVGMFDLNGFARKIMGQNNQPVFNTDPKRTDVPLGAVIPMTPEQEAAAPTWDYEDIPVPVTP